MTVSGMKTILQGRDEGEAVKIDGYDISLVDFVPAEEGFPGYLDLTGCSGSSCGVQS